MPTYLTPPWPALWRTGMVSATFLTIDGQPRSGSVRFTPRVSTVVVHDGVHVVNVAPVTVALDADGAINVALPASDDPNISPTQWTWLVEELDANNLVLRSYDIEVPMGGTTLLAQMSPLDSQPGVLYVMGLYSADQVTALVDAQVPNAVAASMGNYLAKANNLSDLASAATARANLGLGSAATASSTDFDAYGSASEALSVAQSTGLQAANNLSDLTDDFGARSNLGLGSAATLNASSTASANSVAKRDSAGQLSVPTTPTASGHAAAKSYVDSSIDALPKGFLAQTTNASQSIGSIPPGSAQAVAGVAAAVFVLTEQRRVCIKVDVAYAQKTATAGTGWLKPAYCAGDLTGNWLTAHAGLSPLPSGNVTSNIAQTWAGSTAGPTSASFEAEFLLPAGTYTAFSAVARIGGDTSDQFTDSRVRVIDRGNS